MPRRKRRTKGSGSVYRLKGRGWTAQREAPRGPDGKRRYERVSFGRDKLAAYDQISRWEAEKAALARHPRSADSTGEWLRHWLNNKRPNVTIKTHSFYKRHIGYALPYIGEICISELQPQHIRDTLAAITDLSPQSIKHIRTVLSMACKAAVDDGIITRNPCATVASPKVTKYKAYALSEAELSTLMAVLNTHRLVAMWRLLADFGMRLDEILSARWADYDQGRRKLHIKATKNDNERYLSLGETHATMLADFWTVLIQERRDNPAWKERGYLFPSEVGTKMLASNARRAFKKALKDAELPSKIRIHDLRHTAATNFIAAGVDIPTAQYILGHKDSAVLLEIYAHHQEERDQAALAKVEARRRKS